MTSEPQDGERVVRRPRSLTPLIVAVAVSGILLLAVGLMTARRPDPPLPVLASVPEFSLIASDGNPVERADLLGAPWVADLMFTSCAGVCPRMTTEMGRLEQSTRDQPNLRFISVSVDPERDTPEVLTAYAQKLNAERDRWIFLTGENSTIFELARRGFLLPVEEGDPDRKEFAVLHSPRFVLVDSKGRVRGTYDSRETQALARLRRDLKRVDEPPANS